MGAAIRTANSNPNPNLNPNPNPNPNPTPNQVETTEHFFVRLLRIEGGTLASRADLVKIRIKDDDTRIAARLKHAPLYHSIEAVFTIFALVGGELAQRLLEQEHDEWVGHITLTCFFFFALDMLLLHKSEPSYGFSSREFLDAIATIVLLPAVPAFYRHVAPVLGVTATNFLTQGTAARASRAARVGSRAGRLIKHVTRIVEMVATFFASHSKALKTYLKEKKKARKGKKRAKKAADAAAAARAERAERGWGGLQKQGTCQRMALSMATKHAKEPKRISQILSDARKHRSVGGGLHSAEEDQARAAAARKHADKHAQKHALGNQSHVGVHVLELFVSKITLMMLAMLMLNAILGDVTEDYMMKHFRSQTILAANSTGVLELEREFGRASCDSAGSGSDMSLLFVRAYGKELYRGDVELFACRRYVELLYLYDTSECELNLLEPEQQLLNTTYDGCPTIVVFDKKGLENTDIELQLLLTFWLVAILVVGMAFIGSDMQAHLISPIERLTKVIKILSGKAWRKRAKEAATRDDDDGDDDGEKKEQPPPLKRAAMFIDELRQDVYTVSRMAP